VQKFTSDGVFVTMWGGSGESRIEHPRGIACDRMGHVFVVNIGRGAGIVKFTTQGEFVTSFGHFPLLDSPNYIAADAAGNVYVTDSDHQRVVKFSGNGQVLSTWGSGTGAVCPLLKPSGIAVDDRGNVFVSTPDEGVLGATPACIQRFGYPSTPTIRSTWARLKILYR
jgi:DNA-binding beta-propeller fold protein YncE